MIGLHRRQSCATTWHLDHSSKINQKDLENLYQLKRVKKMIRYITQVFRKSLHKVHLEDLAPVFPNFTVMHLNRCQEHPRGCELIRERK